MVVYTIDGTTISLVNNDKKYLYDSTGAKWERCPEYDTADPYAVGYREAQSRTVIKLSREELKRTINGPHAMQTPTTVEEMRFHAQTLPKGYQYIINGWGDQRLREVLIEAEEKHQNPGAVLEAKVHSIIEAEKERERERTETSREATEGPKETRTVPGGHKNTPRKRKQEGSVSVASGGISVLLTPKQLEFMERLSECPGWSEYGTSGTYVASQYAEELSDTMNPMSMGAVLTTLREKKLLTTEKTRIDGMKCCIFKLTEDGKQVYNKLANIETKEELK